ncbi:MAG: RIP metalloprotease RseP [Thalassobaculum sp.]|uniref:RIP metalloprotease RseP n=1 Tax=Thalassobaculum sp. TaxID=2022740 RepID=UPI0032EC79D0
MWAGLVEYVIPFLVILTVLVFVHEMGHYLVARRAGVRVEVFSVGFGRELFGWTARSGTRWKISLLPLGGYVKMFGEADPTSTGGSGVDAMSEDERSVSFHHKPLKSRAAIVAAGPAANFLFAILLLAGLYTFVGRTYAPPVADEVVAGSAAEQGGVKVGDTFVTVDGAAIERFDDLRRAVFERPGQPIELVVERDGSRIPLTVTPATVTETDRFGTQHTFGQLGVRTNRVSIQQLDPVSAIGAAGAETWSIVGQTLNAVGQIIAGTRGTEELGGPLRIAQLSGDVAQRGWVTTIWFMAMLSINLGLINLFPIPVLDGGHLLFYGVEALRGRPLGERAQEWASMAGLTLVIALMLFVTWNDLIHLKVVEYIGSLLG